MKEMRGQVNAAYEDGYGDNVKDDPKKFTTISMVQTPEVTKEGVGIEEAEGQTRAQWGNSMEFLMSCIAMSVGLGNIWRFPFTAYENGGGAFLIPYIIVLCLIGRPLYYMEMVLGQFSARGNVQMYAGVSPGFVGVGYGQFISTLCIATYYCCLMALTLFYLFSSFAAELPWAKCDPIWGDSCFDSTPDGLYSNATNRTSSSELYFYKHVLRQLPDVNDGIGIPDWRLTLCLFISWVFVFVVAMRGVKSSGKAAYFLALFPYVVMAALLVRSVTLPGAMEGIKFFITPKWEKLLMPEVWYAAVTQAFFSLNICFGTITMYSSYNNFDHNVNRDAMVVTTLDTFTSLLAGATIFGILGNLAYVSNKDIDSVVKGDTGLAFVSYPDAIAKFDFSPQFFAVLFFLMLFILGIGSLVALVGNLITVICDQFPHLKNWHVALATSVAGFLLGLIYVTPGGQFMLNLVDYFGGTFIVFVLAIFEVGCISWVYGLENFCLDLEFMLNKKVNTYWRLCWAIFSPGLLILILIYSLLTTKPLRYQDVAYPTSALVAGWLLLAIGVAMLPLGVILAVRKAKKGTANVLSSTFGPTKEWGPKNPQKFKEWKEFKEKAMQERSARGESKMMYICNILLGR